MNLLFLNDAEKDAVEVIWGLQSRVNRVRLGGGEFDDGVGKWKVEQVVNETHSLTLRILFHEELNSPCKYRNVDDEYD